MTELNVLQSLFAVFYAIFWGVVANAQPRWRAFNWPVAFKFTRTRRRLAVAIWLLNLAPVLVFVVFLVMFRGVTLEWAPSGVPWLAGLQIFLAIVAAQVPFALNRLWIGTLEHEPTRYYYQRSEELNLLAAHEPKLDEKDEGGVAISKVWSRGNLLASTGHLVVCIAAAVAINQGGAWRLLVGAGIVLFLIYVAVWALRSKE